MPANNKKYSFALKIRFGRRGGSTDPFLIPHGRAGNLELLCGGITAATIPSNSTGTLTFRLLSLFLLLLTHFLK